MMNRFSATDTLASLKDFQKRTVDYAFHRLFVDEQQTRRFLVADEVGMGKTMIARGLLAKTIEHLQDIEPRIDVIYVCSNADIAQQNVNSLKLPGMDPFAMATRLTLLPLHIHGMRKRKVNLISFTPGTTFDQGHRSGHKEERRLLYKMLCSLPWLKKRALVNALQGPAGDGWFNYVEEEIGFDPDIASDFLLAIQKNASLRMELEWLSDRYHDGRKLRSISSEDRNRCLSLIGKLRQTLAKECLSALEPDLVILDEFQRFRDLLRNPEDSPEAELAHALFNYGKVRMLLLSATPYKMYVQDSEAEDHYKDFIQTARFLFRHDDDLSALERDLKDYRRAMLRVNNDADALAGLPEIRKRVEQKLLSIMCRTERIGHTDSRDGMVAEQLIRPRLSPRDLEAFRLVDRVASDLEQRQDVMEYWKSGSYVLNFMKDYQLKQDLRKRAARRAPELAQLLRSNERLLLDSSAFDHYRDVEVGNPRLRALWDEIEQSGLWQLLWLPPSMPYWQQEGAFATAKGAVKRLLFSAWNLVPDAVSALISYQVERRLVQEAGYAGNYHDMPKRLGQHLRFRMQDKERAASMSTLALMFPSPTLAAEIDPLSIASSLGPQPTLTRVREVAIQRAQALLAPVVDAPTATGAPDRRWYWLALIRLEQRHQPRLVEWCRHRWAAAPRADEKDGVDPDDGQETSFDAHVAHWVECWDTPVPNLGRVPDDLAEVVADLALAGHGTCMLRSLRRSIEHAKLDDWDVLDAAVRGAEGLRSQFNHPLATALLKTSDADAYWQRVLRYGIEGNLQAVLDEYAHMLAERCSLGSISTGATAAKVADAMFEALSLRTVKVMPDIIKVEGDRIDFEPHSIRCHFALRLGEFSEDNKAVARKGAVKEAFNSPFRPFVLTSTSVGQEGLDFHHWCHSVVHWNLPSNPVDMEQREGRVHRYKGHAVRKNVALRYSDRLAEVGPEQDPWRYVFEQANRDKPADSTDLIPYWIYDVPEGSKVQRQIFDMPFSRDTGRYHALKRGLSLYRLAFAQPRQEDLLACLGTHLDETQLAKLVESSLIKLEPPT
ncbi:MAG: helicase domain protein [Moraxellaceae bacterium]|jgi:hypothetical protein|nr:helicase domain protein [Moraxellaceae bacterium]